MDARRWALVGIAGLVGLVGLIGVWKAPANAARSRAGAITFSKNRRPSVPGAPSVGAHSRNAFREEETMSPLWTPAVASESAVRTEAYRTTRIPWFVRHRLVEVDDAQIRPGQTCRLDLFDGQSVEVVLESESPASRISRNRLLRGRVTTGGELMLVCGTDLVVGDVRLSDGSIYEIRPVEGRVHTLRQVNPSKAPPCGSR